jgi:hypothetical protein
MAEPKHQQGDPKLHEVFEQFDGQLVSPGGAAALLGVSRSTVATLITREKLRVFKSSEEDSWKRGPISFKPGPRWVYIPLIDVKRYAEEVGRPFPKFPYGMPVDETDA